MAKAHHNSRAFGWPGAFGVLAIAGLADAVLLTVEHYTRKGLPCTFTGGCERVLTSQYSEIAGQPIALLGVVFYAAVLFLAVHALVNKSPLPRRFLLLWASIGFLSSLALTSLQAFVIKAWCQYCLLSALTSTLIFILAIAYFFTTKSQVTQPSEEDSNE